MIIYTVLSNYYGKGLFGSYTSILRARKALEFYLSESDDIVSITDNNDYTYQFTTRAGEIFSAEILTDTLDWEFENDVIKEGNQSSLTRPARALHKLYHKYVAL